MTSKKLSLTNRVAIAFGLLPALCIVGSEFWQALITGAAADWNYAGKGLLLVCAISAVIYLPCITDKVLYGQGRGVSNAFLRTSSGLALVMMFGSQTHVTGWINPVFPYKAYVGVGRIG